MDIHYLTEYSWDHWTEWFLEKNFSSLDTTQVKLVEIKERPTQLGRWL